MNSLRLALATFFAFTLACCSYADPAPPEANDSPLVGTETTGTEPGDPPNDGARPTFGQPELERMVEEILAIAPEFPQYIYPAEIRMRETDDKGRNLVNAHAGVARRDGKLYPFVEMFRGLVDVAQSDPSVLRAVLAHEIAHLSLGHAVENSTLRDVQHQHTRQEERAADELGARFLEQLGHSREDMVDMLQMLDRHMKEHKVPWLTLTASDHASCITRAAYLIHDDALFAAVSRFEIGLAYMECRRYEQALTFFDEALAMQPDLHEARLNAASAALQNYYDRLPAAVQDAWLRPEFGPHLTDVRALAGRAIEVTDEDLERYQMALDRIDACAPNWYDTMRRFLSATARTLEPQGDAEAIAAGVAELEVLLGEADAADGWGFDRLRLGIVNNLALGLARTGSAPRAMQLLVAEQAQDMSFVPSVAENLSRLPTTGLSQGQAKTVLAALIHYVSFSPEDSPNARAAIGVIERVAKRHKFATPKAASRVPLAYCALASMTIDGQEIGLFDHFTKMEAILGERDAAGRIAAAHAALYFVFWGDREVIALAENDRLVKLTSYRPGSYLTLRPTRRSGMRDTQQVRIGMTETELDAMLEVAGGDKRLKSELIYLLDRSSFSTADGDSEAAAPWRYFPTLNFGVAIRDGVVVGITVTPVK